MGYMKIVKPIIYLVILAAASYVSLWYGFGKGYEYSLSHSLSEAAIKTSLLNDLRSGKTDRAISSLELGIDVDLLEYRYSDKEFINYIAGLPVVADDTHIKLLEIVRKYRDSSPYRCEIEVEGCEEVNSILYGSKEPHNKSLKERDALKRAP